MECGGYRNSCGPRLMPYGKGVPSSYCSDPKYNCMGPCDGKKFVNVHLQEPVSTYPPGSTGGGDQQASGGEPCPLPPINVNIKMCPQGSQFGAGGDCAVQNGGQVNQPPEPFPSSIVTPCCAGGVCAACDYTPRKPRCVDMNFVERTESLKPIYEYTQIPYKLDNRTTYRNFHDGQPGEPAKSFRPNIPYRPTSGKVQHTSEYKYSYIPFPTIPYKKPSWSEQEEFKPIEGHLHDSTTYKTDYQRLVGRPANSTKPRRRIDPNLGPLEDRTTYKVDYPPHCLNERAMSTKPDPLLFVPTVGAPFSGQTMYKSDYVSPCLTTAKSYKPRRRGWMTDAKFDDETTYRNAYLPFTYQVCTPIENVKCFPFNDRDENKREYGSSVW